MLGDRICSLGVVENVQQAVKQGDAEHGHHVAAKEAGGRRPALAQLRHADRYGQHRAIENIDMISEQRAPQAKLGDVTQIKNIVVKGISEAGGGQRCGGDAYFFVGLEIIQKDRIEEKIHQQFFEIK